MQRKTTIGDSSLTSSDIRARAASTSKVRKASSFSSGSPLIAEFHHLACIHHV
jgi:hypothetical protein